MRELLRWFVSSILLFSGSGCGQSIDHGAKLPESREGSKTTPATHLSKGIVSAIIPTFGNGTCPSRTANYITHTLPQQCLRTDRGSSTTNITVAAGSPTEAAGSLSASGFATPSPEGNISPADQVPTLSSSHASAEESTGPTPVGPPSSTGPPTGQASEEEADSPLDNANFLSFEEWKKQNLAKVAPDQGRNAPLNGDRQRPGINNALDSLGEEGEIDLDFSGFGGTPHGPSQPRAAYRQPDDVTDVPTSQTIRSKDAGKTCKERTNYASFDCAAQVLKHNPECKSPTSVLVENKDSYMLNTCSAQNKFFIIELCNDILIDTVVLANYEFFSSIFRHFRVSASKRYPVQMEKWRELGTFEAKNTREIQPFLVEHPQIWARYLRVEFLSHYGSEYYCPVSLLRVHGTTMLEEYRQYDDTGQADGGEDQAAPELESEATTTIPQGSVLSTPEPDKSTMSLSEAQQSLSNKVNTLSNNENENTTNETAAAPSATSHDVPSQNALISIPTLPGPEPYEMTCSSDLANSTIPSSTLMEGSSSNITIIQTPREKATSTSTPDNSSPKSLDVPSDMNNSKRTNGSSTAANSTASETTSVQESSRAVTATESKATDQPDSPPQPANTTSTILDANTSQVSTSTNTTRHVAATSSVAPPQPSTEESFFKSISKRLQQLESNSTLSLQYIEEQSRILRDAFSKVEKRQISSTSTFLSNLNETVIKELHGFRQAYDQLWQSTVLELESQREQYQREMLVLSSRLTLVADELVWQKRMGIVQSGLLLLCLGLVLFARQGVQGHLEVPLMQHMMNKSSAALNRAGWESPPASPSPENRSPVALFRRKLWRSATEPDRVASDHVMDGDITGTDSRPDTRDGPNVDVFIEPPTPPPSRGADSGAVGVFDDADADDEEDVVDPRESQSGPSTPTGTRDIFDRGSNTTNVAIEDGVG